ncbi:hypothetical protein LL947_10745 [Halomonas sp. BLK-85]
MALSPWHIKSRLSSEEVSILLTGNDVTDFLIWPKSEDIEEKNEWHRVLVRAAQEGNLEPEWAETCENDPVPLSEGLRDEWSWEPSFFDEWKTKYVDGVRLKLRRQEVYRWLKASGVTDDDIPEALRVMPKPQAPALQDKPLHHRRRHTYLTLIEALALEALGGEIPLEPYKAAGILQAVLERQGLKLDKDPIANTVKEIQAARDERASERP